MLVRPGAGALSEVWPSRGVAFSFQDTCQCPPPSPTRAEKLLGKGANTSDHKGVRNSLLLGAVGTAGERLTSSM